MLQKIIQTRYMTFSHCETARTMKTAKSKQTLSHNVKLCHHIITHMQKHILSAVPEATGLFVIKNIFYVITEKVFYVE